MRSPCKVIPLPGYRLELTYPDGVCGVLDLSEMVGKGVFKAWEDIEFFNGVYVGEFGQIAWSDEIDICPDSTYFRLAGGNNK